MPENQIQLNTLKLPQVAVLLCTRDGSSFIDQQLESLIHQQQVDRLTSLIEEKEKNLQFKGFCSLSETWGR